ncbi:ABC transporter permease [Roseomonas sp. BN140053]|uniref:ABC transporter permease n=1 Tax=Roseomonas sp. BN140053 TaxID=3391898 RepID=UPI0039E9EEF1
MSAEALLAQGLNGLASASSLFLLASGLTLIFGVSRVVNFAHGSLYMLGAFLGWTVSAGWGLGFWWALLLVPLATAAGGALLEMLLLRRLYAAPELYQLLATFALVLIAQDAALWLWGPQDLLGPRATGLRGTVAVLGTRFPLYELFLLALGPLVLGLLLLLLRFTRFGLLLRAATADREMLSALGTDARWLFTGVFALGAGLAALAGVLQLPRAPVTLNMDLPAVVDAFVVVVVGGLGSVTGAFLAALLIGLLQAWGILLLPKVTLVLVFAVMAVVLAFRPYGLLGRPLAPALQDAAPPLPPAPAWSPWLWGAALVAVPLALPFLPAHGVSIVTQGATMALFAASLHLLLGPAGITSFGHAAWFGAGSYAAALGVRHLGAPMELGLLAAPLLAGALGWLGGLVVLRLSGVYAAMLTLALTQILFSAAFQWSDWTGGDNGVLGVWPAEWVRDPLRYAYLALLLCGGGVWLLRRLVRSPFGLALRAARDAPHRAEAAGLPVPRLRRAAFALAAAAAGLAGAVFSYAQGSVFPSVLGLGRSVDGLLMVLLGGIHSLSGPVLGAVAWTLLNEQLVRATDYWRAVLGLVVLALVLFFPRGLLGARQASR